MSNLLSLTSAQLKQAADIKDKIEVLTKELNSILGGSVASVKPAKKGMSAAGKAKIAAAQKLRWAKVNAAKGVKLIVKAAKPVAKKRKMSAEGKARIVAAQKARWAKIHAAKKA